MIEKFKNNFPFISTILLESISSFMVLLFMGKWFGFFAVLAFISLVILKENAWMVTAGLLVGLGFTYASNGMTQEQLIVSGLAVGGSLFEIVVRLIQSLIQPSSKIGSAVWINILFAIFGTALWAGVMYYGCSGYAPDSQMIVPDDGTPASAQVNQFYSQTKLSLILGKYSACTDNYMQTKENNLLILTAGENIQKEMNAMSANHPQDAVGARANLLLLLQLAGDYVVTWLRVISSGFLGVFFIPFFYSVVAAGFSASLFWKFSISRWFIQSLKAFFAAGVFVTVLQIIFGLLKGIMFVGLIAAYIFYLPTVEQMQHAFDIIAIVSVAFVIVGMAIASGIGAGIGLNKK